MAFVGGAYWRARDRTAIRPRKIPCSAGNNREFESGPLCAAIAAAAGGWPGRPSWAVAKSLPSCCTPVRMPAPDLDGRRWT
jgi:hypothetical protein